MPALVADEAASFMSKVALILKPARPKPARDDKAEDSKTET
jgi:hypothetical protein